MSGFPKHPVLGEPSVVTPRHRIERRLDTVRSVCHIAQKRLIACFQGQHGTDPDKRHKKLPLTALAQNMQEGSVQLSDETLLGYNQAHKTSGTNFQVHPSKIESLKEEMDEAGNKVEQCKDQLAADMYNFVSKEGEYAKCFVTLLEAQADYHRKALAVIEKVLPEIQAHQDKWTEKPAFGTPLEEHLKRSGREIAVPIEACVMMLLETGMREEGLFRIAAGASKLKKLKAALDCSTSQLDEFYSDPHAVADQDFNVSGAFVAVPAVNSNHLSHTGNEYESGTLERKRPLSMTVMEGDLLKKERYVPFSDSNSSIQEPLQNPSPELLTETASKELHNHLMLDIDNDTESTAL
ncbi:rho gtpase-activating protein hypothetical protein [Limosa lapponica baueri]|uniref:Rho gtpase-activating protein 17 n=1 Tax=Limosa lapponica baueri TaxID=1758121 RepID=A0A2I0TNF7_LIMLA|nr:rho gtpase-activating protein hypothetical protein [Limosa lapponica baueri]